jgi:hypothetical protein
MAIVGLEGLSQLEDSLSIRYRTRDIPASILGTCISNLRHQVLVCALGPHYWRVATVTSAPLHPLTTDPDPKEVGCKNVEWYSRNWNGGLEVTKLPKLQLAGQEEPAPRK